MITEFRLQNPNRIEYRLPNELDPETGDPIIIRHNDNGPAVVTDKGYKAWYQNGLRHRADGPAIEFRKFRVWYVNGKLHRTDGPAIEFTNGEVQYWENGIKVK